MNIGKKVTETKTKIIIKNKKCTFDKQKYKQVKKFSI